jgi:spore cortex formation protein SpoVR/YcgB (stage V sporulation)
MFEDRVAELEALARQQGLDFFPTAFEVVPQDIMTEMAAMACRVLWCRT